VTAAAREQDVIHEEQLKYEARQQYLAEAVAQRAHEN